LRRTKHYEWHELLSKDTAASKKKKPTNAKTASNPMEQTAETKTTTVKPSSSKAASTKTSAIPRLYSSDRDWDLIEKMITEEEIEKPEGSEEAMNKLFAQIYANADTETQRDMVKSYQTSGGVLSTNWNEVETTDKGLEWKNWEGDKLPMKDDD
jgi:hypothetical protein